MQTDVLIVGGGAAGFFTAITIAAQSNLKVVVVERGKEVLTKVKVSGGGRCNVTHAEFIPKELVKYYPRGEKELRGPFHSFMSGDIMAWFDERGVALKIEDDGRVFPESDSSQTIIDCFLNEAKIHDVTVLKGHSVTSIKPAQNLFEVVAGSTVIKAKNIVVATGSNPKVWNLLADLGHTIVQPVPSLFTFNCKHKAIKHLPGVSAMVSLKIKNTKLESEGPLLITHWGFSGPAILKLSAWGARILHELEYRFTLQVNWLQNITYEEAVAELMKTKETEPKKLVVNTRKYYLPKRLWEMLVESAQLNDTKWADVSKKQIHHLAVVLVSQEFAINGKSTFKEEFVTAGGVALKEIDFRTFESKIVSGLYLAGEVLNIDAITGGFNFQNAWTGGYLAAKAILTK